MIIDKMRRRPNIPQEWPASAGETEASWSDRLTAKGSEYGVYRQCSIGWHAECSQRHIIGDACPCRCKCHTSAEAVDVENVDQPPGVDVHDQDKQFPPVSEAAARALEFVAWFGDGLVLPGGELLGSPPLYARDLEALAKAAAAPPAEVLAFINQRPEYITALKNTRGTDDQADYNRWQGHAESRRQLTQALGYTVPHNTGDTTTKKEES